MNVELSELGLAYRRVKSDLYYTRNANLFKLLRFEKELSKNLRWLWGVLSRESFYELNGECVGYRLVPKDVKFKDENNNADVYTTRTDGENREVESCELRVVENLPISFHVIMQLWIDRVGYKLERNLSDDVYGYRIRLHGRDVNRKYPGTFKYYIRQYRNWHDGGLDKINDALKTGKRVVAMTADFSAFYHRLTADFLLNESYIKALGGRKIVGDDLTLTQLVVRMLRKWAENTPLTIGLPVGCSISSVIANLALASFDKQIGNIQGLVYYGRYVDDILFAVENSGNIGNQQELLNFIKSKVSGLEIKSDNIEYFNVDLKLPKETSLGFNRDKMRVFFLEPGGGETFIEALKSQIGKRTSEWRALPELPDNPEVLINNIVSITDSKGVEVDKLRKAEDVSIRRAAFAMKLSDFGDYATFLPPLTWQSQRMAFLEMVKTYFCSVKSYYELSVYFPRLIGLASLGVTADDNKSQALILGIYQKVKKALETSISGRIKIAGEDIKHWELEKADVVDRVFESVCAGFREALAAAVKDTKVREKLYLDLGTVFVDQKGMVENTLPDYDELILSDLAWIPYKSILMTVYDQKQESLETNCHQITCIEDLLPNEYINLVPQILSSNPRWRKILRNKAVSGLLFPTRPLKVIELCSVLPNPYSSDDGSRDIVIEYLKTMNYGDKDVDFVKLLHDSDNNLVVNWSRGPITGKIVANNQVRLNSSWNSVEYKPKVALAYWRIEDTAWYEQFDGRTCEKKQINFTRLMRFLNRLTRSNSKIDYVVFPELAMPWQWFLLIANELKKRNISLISGVEYLWTAENEVSNEAWCNLMTDSMGFPDAVLIRVVKTAPAEHEGEELESRGLTLRKAAFSREFCAGDIIRHGNDYEALFFSVLICSDLTDIGLRNKLRGKIDALFVPAWNTDVETFNALVMASALDLHAYVILANNGEFGDVRIRAPRYERYRRDILQLNGGEYDYYVVGTLDVDSLRRAEAKCRLPSDPLYKAVPIGYQMSAGRSEIVRKVVVDYGSLHLKYVKPCDGYYNVVFRDNRGKECCCKVDFSKISSKEGLLSWIVSVTKVSNIPKEAIYEVICAAKLGLGVSVEGV